MVIPPTRNHAAAALSDMADVLTISIIWGLWYAIYSNLYGIQILRMGRGFGNLFEIRNGLKRVQPIPEINEVGVGQTGFLKKWNNVHLQSTAQYMD